MVSQTLNSVEVGLQMTQLLNTLHAECDKYKDVIKLFEERYQNTDNPEERDALILDFLNGNEEIYVLTQIDTSIIPDVVKNLGDITLDTAMRILFVSEDMSPDDVSAFASKFIEEESLKVTDPEHPTLQNILVTGLNATRIKHHYDAMKYLNMPELFKQHVIKGEFDMMEIALYTIVRYTMILNAGKM